MEDEFYNLVNQIHNKIERGEKQFRLMDDKVAWNRFCASVYAIEDAQCAIDAYCEMPFPDDTKGKYLYIYGLLQALFLQQDATNGLSITLCTERISFKEKFPSLYQIREIRNDTIGHPTERTHRQGKSTTVSYVQISQITIHKDGFHYCLYRQENNFEFEDKFVDLSSVITEQRRCILIILSEVCTYLDKEYQEYLKKFEGIRMVEIFQSLNYAAEKALYDDYLAATGMDVAKSMVSKCKDALIERYGAWDALDSFHYLIKSIEELFNLLESLEVGNNYPKVKYYLTELIFVKLKSLRDLCREVDEEFEADSEDI